MTKQLELGLLQKEIYEAFDKKIQQEINKGINVNIKFVRDSMGLLIEFVDWYNEDSEKTPITQDEIEMFIKEKI